MKATVIMDVWFDVGDWTEEALTEAIEDAIDSYNGSADVRSIKIVADDEDEVPTHYVIGYLAYNHVDYPIVGTGHNYLGKYYEVSTKAGTVTKVYHNDKLVTHVELH